MNVIAADFRTTIADRCDASQELLAARWREELKRIVSVEEDEIFPGDDPLGQLPLLIRELAAFLKAPAGDAIAANAVVTTFAVELGRLRHAQHASVYQVQHEYRALRTVVAEFIKDESCRLNLNPQVDEIVDLMERVDAAIDVLMQNTINTFVTEYSQTITEHTSRLEGFNRMVSHELRQPLGIFQFAVKLLRGDDTWPDRAKRDQILDSAERSVARMTETLTKLVALSRSSHGAESAAVQRVDLEAMVNAVRDQLREMAEARGVEVEIDAPLPSLTIDAARLELVLVNLISNAIKYTDPQKPRRVVQITCTPGERPEVCVVRVTDNGIGIAETDLRSIFGRFYRGRPDRDRELGTTGLGLGLSIVAECVDALKGDVRVESTLGEGTTFILELPLSPPA
jgi:signal transduction histidine kinase